VTGRYEYGNEHSSSMQREKLLDYMGDSLPAVKADLKILLKTRGHSMYHQLNIQQLYVQPTHCIYVFCVDLRTNSDYFPIQH
jgi:hypothetical protein